MRSSSLIMCSALVLAITTYSFEAKAESGIIFTPTEWCSDTITFCSEKSATRSYLSGARLVFEPSLGYIIQRGDYQFEPTSMAGAGSFSIESTIFEGWLGFQIGFISPFTGKFDVDTPRTLKTDDVENVNQNREVSVRFGTFGGVTLFNSVLTIGGGTLFYDTRQFLPDTGKQSWDGFAYIGIQPISLIRGIGIANKD